MAELLDPNGVWTAELLALMLPVAIDLEADTALMHFSASAAAVSMIGGKKGADAYTANLRGLKAQARGAMRQSRGLPAQKPPEKPGESAAEQMLSIFGQMGLRPKRKRAKTNPQPTKKHKR